MSLEVKKLRAMWTEKINLGEGENIDFLCSFDEGSSWTSFGDILGDIRTSATSNRTIPLATYEAIDDEYSSIDFTIPLTFDSVPEIQTSKSTVTPYLNSDTNGLPSGDYLIKVATISSDLVGLTASSSRIANMSFVSPTAEFSLPYRGDIDLVIQFNDNAKGLAIYLGKSTKIIFDATITESSSSAVFTKYTVNGYTGEIPIEYGSIFGTSLILSIDYNSSSVTTNGSTTALTEDMINSFSISETNKATITFAGITLSAGDSVHIEVNTEHYRLAFISNLVTKLVKPIEASSSADIWIDPKYPLPYSGRIKVDSEYINYESLDFSSDSDYPEGYYILSGITRETPSATHDTGTLVYLAMLDGGSYGELPAKSIAVYRNVDNLELYYNFESISSSSDAITDMVSNYTGRIIGTVDSGSADSYLKNSAVFNSAGIILSKYNFGQNGSIHFYIKIDEVPEEDVYIFGVEDGLKLKLDKNNLRLSLEHDSTEIVKSTNPKLSKVRLDEWTEIGISWQYSSTYSISRIYLYKDGILEVDEDFSMPPGEKYYAIGGLLTTTDSDTLGEDYTTAEYSNSFKGKIDDWRIYGVALSLDELADIDTNLKEYSYEYCGTVTLDKRFANGNTLLDYYLYDSSLLKYEPSVITYFSVLSADSEEVNSLGANGTTCDLWPLFAIENGNYFEASLISGLLNTENTAYGYVIKKSDGKDLARINAPINPSTIKYRFELTGQSNGLSSPSLEKFATIISSSTIDFE